MPVPPQNKFEPNSLWSVLEELLSEVKAKAMEELMGRDHNFLGNGLNRFYGVETWSRTGLVKSGGLDG